MATTVTPRAEARVERLERIWAEREGLLGWITTTDHKRIGIMYFFTSLALFGAGGVEALLIRTQLIGPNGHVLSPQAYDEVFTMHGITMIFLFVIPMTTGAFGNYLIPLMIGARDMAFPRMNAVSYWIYLASAIFMYAGLAGGHAPNSGWFDYVPLASKTYDPGNNIDFYGWGLIFNGISSTAASINIIVTIFKLRAPGMSFNRMPLFCFAFLAVSFSLLFALPSLSARHASSSSSTATSASTSTTPPTAAIHCSGRTCSGSSATPRSTSSSCPRSGSPPRSSPPSPSARWCSSRWSRWPSCWWRSSASACGSTTCSWSASQRSPRSTSPPPA